MKKMLCCLFVLLILLPSLNCRAISVSAKSAAAIDGITHSIIYGKNPHIRLPMASTTKIMTALLLCEQSDPDRKIIITEEMVRTEGSSMGLMPGDIITLRDLLYGIMLVSGNDAAKAAAIAVSGSEAEFVKLMNRRACEMKLKDTHFETASGLDGEYHYTTAYELALITAEALKNETFASVCSEKYHKVTFGNPPRERLLKNHNKLLSLYDGAVGVKTGFTKKSGRCLVSAVRKDGKFIIAVTLNAPDDWNDHKSILDYSLQQTDTYKAVGKRKFLIDTAQKGVYLNAECEELNLNIYKGAKPECQILLPDFVYAPLNVNEKIGSIRIYCGKEIIAEQPIVSTENLGKEKDSEVLKFKNIFIYILSFIYSGV